MKLVRFIVNGRESNGILEGSQIIELEQSFLINNSEKSGKIFELSDVELLPPVVPEKVIVIGLNYVKHAEEVNKPVPEEPMIFMVSPTAIIAHQEEIKIPFLDHETHFEAELTIVIGKEAKNVRKESAKEYILGYTIANDVSDRTLQRKDIQFTRAKSYDTFKPLGPLIETSIDPNNLGIKLKLNGDTKQDSNTNDLVFNVEELIEKVSTVMTLNPGDIILTGTPSGVGPLKPGDHIMIEIEGIGKLENKVSY